MYTPIGIDIAESLINAHLKSDTGIYWHTYYLPYGEEKSELMLNNSLYNGNTGITLFFLELYNITRATKYKNIVLESIKWEIDYYETTSKDSENYAFLTGNMSLVYLLIRANEILKDQDYLAHASAIAKNAIYFINYHICDFINGISGTLWTLLKLYSHTKEDWTLDFIKKYTWEILNRLNISQEGVYWDRNNRQIRGLCGFSHGASGVGYVLIQVGQFFKIDSLIQLGLESFRYENQYFDTSTCNWIDFRKSMDVTEENVFRTAFLNEDYVFFEGGGFMNAWCHGAAGLVLPRIYAKYFLKNDAVEKDINLALQSLNDYFNKEGTNYSHSLCHGMMGNLEAYIELEGLSENEKYKVNIIKNIDNVIAENKTSGFYASGVPNTDQDTSLFLGDAGIGYQLLRASFPKEVPSILLPKVTNLEEDDFSDKFNIELKTVITLLINKFFPRCCLFAQSIFKKEYENFIDNITEINIKYIYDKWIPFFAEKSKRLNDQDTKLATELLNLELLKYHLDISIRSNAYLNYKELYHEELIGKYQDANNKFTPVVFEKMLFFVDKYLEIITCSGNWYYFNNIFSNQTAILHYVILQPKYWGVQEFWFEGKLIPLILSIFKQETSFQNGLARIIESIDFESNDPSVIQETKSYISEVFINLLKLGIIRFSEKNL